MKTTKKFVTVPLMALTLLASGLGFQVNQARAFGATPQVSPVINPATGYPLWYEDTTLGGGSKLQMCLGVNADGTGAIDPKCAGALPGQPSPIQAATAVGTNFPTAAFYYMAEAPLTINGNFARFRIILEAAYAGGVVVAGDETVISRALLQATQQGTFPASSTFHVVYPFGAFDFSTDAIGDFVAIPASLPFFVSSGGKEMRAEDTLGTPPTFDQLFATNRPGFTNFLETVGADVNTPGYLGDGVSAAPVTGGTNGNIVTITQTAGVGPFVVTGGTDWIVTGKLFAPAVTVTSQTVLAATASTITGTVSDSTATVNVTVGANTNILATVTGTTWSVTLPAPLTAGNYDVTVTTGLATPNESATTVTNAIAVNPATPPMFRFRSLRTPGAYLFTIDTAEKASIEATRTAEWTFEGPVFNAFQVAEPGSSPMYRFRSLVTPGSYLFTIDTVERDNIVATRANEWTLEGPVFHAFQTQVAGTQPMFRFRSLRTPGAYLFTIDAAEKTSIETTRTAEWALEGPVFFAIP